MQIQVGVVSSGPTPLSVAKTIQPPTASVATMTRRVERPAGPCTRRGFLMTPSSLAQAISEPDSDTAPISAPSRVTHELGDAVGPAAEQLDRGDRAGRAAAHAVVDRHHLRHGGHGDLACREPGAAAADGQGDDGEADD